jgi:hypothetical protein
MNQIQVNLPSVIPTWRSCQWNYSCSETGSTPRAKCTRCLQCSPSPQTVMSEGWRHTYGDSLVQLVNLTQQLANICSVSTTTCSGVPLYQQRDEKVIHVAVPNPPTSRDKRHLIAYLTTLSTIILLAVLYVCETWSLTLREGHRLRVFENRVLRRIFGPKRDEVTGGWTKLHNEELHNLYSSPSIIKMIKSRRMRWAGHVARIGAKRNACRVLLGKPERKMPLRKQKT